MKTTVALSIALVVAHAVSLVESGYLVTSPRSFHAGSTQELSISLIDVNEPWVINSTVSYKHGGGEIASDGAQFTSDADGTLKLKIPRDLKTNGKQSIRAKLTVFGGPADGKLAFQKSEMISIDIPKNSIFIQTDKPIYKPGQTVNMRIVGVDENLKPLTGQIERVTITSPSGVRTMQWDDSAFAVGIVSLKFPLSSQPVLGDWKIEATFKGEKKTLVFKVDKYVLPKFEVTIEPPAFVSMKSKVITATICAHYTYGQPVKGSFSALFALKMPRWYRTYEAQTTTTGEINGCTDVTINSDILKTNLRHHYDYSYYYSSSKIAINATVKEAATGVSQNATGTETQVIRATAKLEFLPNTPQTFKPAMAYSGQLKATLPDGSPMKGETVEIIVNSRSSQWYWGNSDEFFRERFTVPESGIVDFVVPSSKIPESAKTLSLEGKYRGKNLAYYNAKRWYSPSSSYMSMERILTPQKVGSTAKVLFNFTTGTATKNINFHYQVFSRGKLVAQGKKPHAVDYQPSMKTFKNSKSEEMFISQGFVEFTVTQKMVPSCRLLLFYVRDDKETVADNMLVDVEDTLENKVDVRFSDSIRKPGEPTRLIITAAPGSQVAVTAVDKSVHLLKGGNELTQDDAISVLSSQDVGPSGRYRPDSCYGRPRWWFWGPLQRRSKRTVMPHYGSTKDLDASKAFEETGVIYFSDLKIETAQCERPRRPPYLAEMHLSSSGGREVFESIDGPAGPPSPDGRTTNPKNANQRGEPKKKPLYVRKEFPETWLWTEEVVNKDTGKTVIMAKVPDTITSWIASAFAMSDAAGLGVSKPTPLKVFQPFFVSLTLPYSVIRGEEVSIITTVFNYEKKCLTIRLDLQDSLYYRILSNYSHTVCVCSNEARSVRFNIVPKKLGEIPLTVIAKDVNSSVCDEGVEQMALGVTDAVTRKLLVEPEGVRQEYTYNSFVCLKDDESHFNDSMEISLPKNVVAGSVHAVVSTVGDLMGPTLNVGSLLRLPYGCGEQNMVNFAPSIYIMQYLSTVGQLTTSLENKAKNIMTTGYQRELSYKRTDGSYSAFGNSDSEGNMWLTAFVLRSFAQARPFIFVDSDELKHTQSWITNKQLVNGCFPKYGRLFNKRLKGGVSTEATLTAFVAVSLMESGMSAQDKVIQNALNCLRTASSNLTDSYSLALFSYTFTLAGDQDASDLFKALQAKAINKEGLVHWEKEKEVKPTPSEYIWWNPYYRAPAADIEMTAYALMTYVLLAQDDVSLIGEAMPIVRWLTKQRNALGGFSSTQDTCVALQALSKYARDVYSNTTDLTVQFGEDNSQFSHTFSITDNNRLVSQRAQVPSDILPMKDLPVKVDGQGCALMQADVSYNIPDVKEEPAFDLKVSLKLSEDVFGSILTTETGDPLCLPLDVSINAKWLREDSSNMAVIDVKLVSGYQVEEESLDKLTNNPKLGLKRYEMEGQHVILYFDEIDKVSFSFKIHQSTMVKKTKPASVMVYDYYETHLSATVMYKITEDMCGLDPIDQP
ncbi:C3 and PZP-like alpha-2-macroglobulin domain-containing protein 8 isoform X2 [Oculina patagonica]